MSVETKVLFEKEQIESFSDARKEPEWLRDLRLKGLELTETTELPKPDKTKIDKWNFIQRNFDLAAKAAVNAVSELPEALRALIGEESADQNLFVQQDTSAVLNKVSADLAEKGVIFTDLQTAIAEHADKVKPYFFGEAVKPAENRLLALHAALVKWWSIYLRTEKCTSRSAASSRIFF